MPRVRSAYRDLPPAAMTDALLSRISTHIPEKLSNHVTWSVGIDGDEVSNSQLASFLEEIKDEMRFNFFQLEVLDDTDPSNAFQFNCDSDGTWLIYNIPRVKETHFKNLADDIEHTLNGDKRLFLFRMPSKIRPKILRKSRLLLGHAPPPLFSGLNRAKIVEDILSRVVAHGVTLFAGVVVGWLVGFFTGPLVRSLFSWIGELLGVFN